MPGEFYVETKGGKVNLVPIETSLADLQAKVDGIKTQTDKLAGEIPGQGSVTADWQTAESEVVTIGAHNVWYKVHSLVISIHNLVGTIVTARLYMLVNGVERKVYEQIFDAAIDPPGLWIINGTVGIHEMLRVTLQSNNAADNGQAIDFNYMMEEM